MHSKIGLLSLAFSFIAALSFSSQCTVLAFQSTSRPSLACTVLSAESSKNDITSQSTRRNALQKSAGLALSILFSGTAMSESANASYSAYTRREDDWKGREKAGEIKYSTARDLRSQLREIAPMNSEGSSIFCPNGPSANVSPLMENKCGDRMALPSVYGRSNDIMGNSIPGFGSNGAATSSAAVAQLRDELNAQAYFR